MGSRLVGLYLESALVGIGLSWKGQSPRCENQDADNERHSYYRGESGSMLWQLQEMVKDNLSFPQCYINYRESSVSEQVPKSNCYPLAYVVLKFGPNTDNNVLNGTRNRIKFN